MYVSTPIRSESGILMISRQMNLYNIDKKKLNRYDIENICWLQRF
jgi:hypothetical protein